MTKAGVSLGSWLSVSRFCRLGVLQIRTKRRHDGSRIHLDGITCFAEMLRDGMEMDRREP